MSESIDTIKFNNFKHRKTCRRISINFSIRADRISLGVPALVVTISIVQHQHGINDAGLICELAQFTHGLLAECLSVPTEAIIPKPPASESGIAN